MLSAPRLLRNEKKEEKKLDSQETSKKAVLNSQYSMNACMHNALHIASEQEKSPRFPVAMLLQCLTCRNQLVHQNKQTDRTS